MTTKTRTVKEAIAACLLLVGGSGCGFGTGGVIASLKNSGGSANAPVTPGGLLVLQSKVSPAPLQLVLNDREADTATVQFFYVLPGSGGQERPMTRIGPNPAKLTASPSGIVHTLPWDFAGEAGLPADGSFIDGVTVIARVQGGVTQTTITGLGNDAPVVTALVPPTSEITGVVPVGFRIEDSSDDVVDVEAEFFVQAQPELGWRRARPAGPNASTTGPAFVGLVAGRGGVDLTFFWDTDSLQGDLRQLEREVRVRFTARDQVAVGASRESGLFRVDNNAAPVLQLGEGAFATNPDERRGIPIPFTVRDAEGDAVRVLFQWRRENQPAFPDLGTTDPEELAQLVQDPRWVREKQVCVPFPSYARGYAVPVDDTHVRLPEVRQSESRLLAGRMELRQLELLRPTGITGLAASWAQNPLLRPVAALPFGNGTTALVLDGQGTSRLLELDLATGTIERTIAQGAVGIPTALAMDSDQQRALVATDLGGSWQVLEVELATGVVSLRVTASGGAATPTGAPRALLPMGTNCALATADDSLWRLDWSTTPARIVRLRGNLAGPWGLVEDPQRPGRVLVAERDADRIVTIDVQSRDMVPLPATRSGGTALPRPTAIALSEAGTGPRLVVLCDGANPTELEVCGLNLGQQDHAVFELGRVGADARTVAAGEADLCLVALPQSRDVAAGGGVEQVREVLAFEVATGTATVGSAFTPAVGSGQEWRIAPALPLFGAIRGTPEGTDGVFVFDVFDATLGFGDCRVFLNAVPMDADLGDAVDTAVPRAVGNADIGELAVGALPTSAAAADLDGDGDLDLVCADSGRGTLTLLYQDAPRSFTVAPLTVGGLPTSVAAADLDGDGDLDLVCANSNFYDGSRLTVLYQDAPRTFTAEAPLAVGDYLYSVAAADLDGDGDLDLVCANAGSDTLTLLYQDAPRSFTEAPLAVGDYVFSVAAADLDGDGDLDLVCANEGSDTLTLLYQDAPRSFTVAPLAVGGGPRSVTTADLDGDGDLDLVCATQSPATLTVLYQDAPRRFTEAAPLAGAASPAVAVDVDGDGDQDLVCANRGSDTLTVLYQDAPRSFKALGPLAVGDAPSSVAAADLDGDGDQDLVCTNELSYTLMVLYQDAPRSFTSMPPLAVGDGPSSAAAADLDGDGDLDLVCTDQISDTLTVLYQEAPRSFTAIAPLAVGAFPGSVVAADLDGDGDLDLVCARSNWLFSVSNTLTVLYQEAPRSFTAVAPLAVGGVPVSVAAADLDGDGDLDLVCANANQFGNTLTVLYQDAPRSFTAIAPLAVGGPPTSVAAADFDGDGDLDLVCATQSLATLTVLYQEAPRSFTAVAPLAVGGSPLSVAAADLDGDGDLDLACANFGSNTLTVLYQDAPRSFTVASLAVGGSPLSVAAADLDGDGDLDLVCATQSPATLTVLYQDAPRRFTSVAPLAVAASSVVAADVDGDGDQDLVCANSNSDTLTVLLGRSR